MPRLPIKIKENAFSLRKGGHSVKEIAKRLHISQSTASVWIRDIQLNKKAQDRLNKRKLLGYYKTSLRWKKKRNTDEILRISKTQGILKGMGIDSNNQKIYCALLYCCEGGKSDKDPIKFVNSDPDLIRAFLESFRRGFNIRDEKKFRVLMHLHAYHNEQIQKRFWSKITRIPELQFHKTFRKANTEKRIKENYPGCIAISYYDNKIAREVRTLGRILLQKIGT